MPVVSHSLPTEVSNAGDLARQLARLVGPAVQSPDDSISAQEYLALGGALATIRQTTLDSISEAFPHSANNLLSEWEEMLLIPVAAGVSQASRRNAILARLRARGGTPQRVERALTVLAGSTITTGEYAYAAVASQPRRVFRFTVAVPVAVLLDAELINDMHEILERASSAHAVWQFSSAEVLRFSTVGAGFGTPFGPVTT